ncbi:CGP-CTERM-anchored Cys-rich protein [Thermococcus sp.]
MFNKPGITYNLEPLKDAKNVLIEGERIIYRSHYDERVAVMLWEDKGLHLRIEIPVKSWNSTVLSAKFTTPMIFSENSIEKAKELGWEVEGKYTFRKDNILVQITSQKERECSKDSDCSTGGCSGEICTNRENATKVVSICVYKDWYECLKLTTCGCVNGVCSWKLNDAFERCLKEHGIDPSRVIKMPQADVYIAIYGQKELSGEKRAEIKELFSVLGIGCVLENIKFEKRVTSMPEGIVNPYTFNFKEALRVEIEWLKESGILKISDEDIEEIVKVAKRGYAGYNSHIGWYETKDGEYAWIPYYESKDAKLVKCLGKPVTYQLPKGAVELGKSPQSEITQTPSTSKSPTSSAICGTGIVILGILLPLPLGRKD